MRRPRGAVWEKLSSRLLSRRVGLVLALLVGGLLAACASDSDPTPSPGVSAGPSPQTTYQVGIIPSVPGTPVASPAAPPGTPVAGPSRAATPVSSPVALPKGDTIPRIEGELTIFAAASLTDAFNEIKTAIEAVNPGARISYNFAGSSALRTQLAQGAGADIFASADERTMDGARQDGTVATEPRIFAQNRLVVIVPAANAAGLYTLQDLARSGVKLVLAQEQVPAGGYARQALDTMSQDAPFGADFKQRLLANVVSHEANVKQVVAKVQLGEADAGIVYSSDVTPAVRAAVKTIEIPDQFNVVAQYPIAVVEGAANPSGAQAFIDYLLSAAGQTLLQHHGFLPISAGKR